MKTEWISCKDRLPEASGKYLTVDMDSKYPCQNTLYYSAKWSGWNCCESIDDEQDAKEHELRVTHWMQLPELPEVRS